MAHDYDEQMSLMLDGQLAAQERAKLEAHLAVCGACRARWVAFQQVDHVLANAAQVMPAPGFAARFATRRVRQEARRRVPQRVLGGIGVFATGAVALALLAMSTLIAAWQVIGDLAKGGSPLLNNLVAGVPSQLGYLLVLAARWLVTLRAFGAAGEATLNVLARSGGPILAGYILILAGIMAAWAMVMRSAFGRKNTMTLPVLVWL